MKCHFLEKDSRLLSLDTLGRQLDDHGRDSFSRKLLIIIIITCIWSKHMFTYQYFVLYFEMVDKQVIVGISRVLLPPGGPDGGEKTAV